MPRYPQSNGQAEVTNKTIMSNLKKKLESYKGRWLDELPGLLWAYRATLQLAIDKSLFSLVYIVDAVIPTDIRVTNLITKLAWPNESINDQMMADHHDLIKKEREQALIRLAYYQQAIAHHYNSRVKE